jgi:hypothetical protein
MFHRLPPWGRVRVRDSLGHQTASADYSSPAAPGQADPGLRSKNALLNLYRLAPARAANATRQRRPANCKNQPAARFQAACLFVYYDERRAEWCCRGPARTHACATAVYRASCLCAVGAGFKPAPTTQNDRGGPVTTRPKHRRTTVAGGLKTGPYSAKAWCAVHGGGTGMGACRTPAAPFGVSFVIVYEEARGLDPCRRLILTICRAPLPGRVCCPRRCQPVEIQQSVFRAKARIGLTGGRRAAIIG